MLQQFYDNPYWFYSLVGISVVTFIASLIIIPWLIIRLPEDYFLGAKRQSGKTKNQHPAIYFTIRIIKNMVGIMLIILGLAMIVLPGQGILTMLIGLSMMDFPGKYTFERNLTSRPSVSRSINWIRRRANKPPLIFHEK